MVGKKFMDAVGFPVLMRPSKGVYYGNLDTIQATAYEVPGYKHLNFVTTVPACNRAWLQGEINKRDLEAEFSITDLTINQGSICVTFRNRRGVTEQIREFEDWFVRLLHYAHASRINVCLECGGINREGRWLLIGDKAYHLHQNCADRVRRTLLDDEELDWVAEKGTYLRGLAGALVGTLLGVVCWILVSKLLWSARWAIDLYLGYALPLMGMVIAWLTDKGYRLFKGRQGRGKKAIVITSVILGVLLAWLGPDIYLAFVMIGNGQLPGYGYGDVPVVLMEMLNGNYGYIVLLVFNFVFGLASAGFALRHLLHPAREEFYGDVVCYLD